MKVLTEALKTMLDALAHQDAAEFLTPRQKTAVLAKAQDLQTDQIVEPTVLEPAPVARRRVALFTGRELPRDVMDYVTQICGRLQHDLTIVTFESERTAQATLEPYRNDLDTAGIDVKLVTLGGNTLSQLARYLDNHPEIAFLACKETGYLGHSYLTGNQFKNKMPVPVVVIVANKGQSQLPGADLMESGTDSKIA